MAEQVYCMCDGAKYSFGVGAAFFFFFRFPLLKLTNAIRHQKVNRNSIIERCGWSTLDAFRHSLNMYQAKGEEEKRKCWAPDEWLVSNPIADWELMPRQWKSNKVRNLNSDGWRKLRFCVFQSTPRQTWKIWFFLCWFCLLFGDLRKSQFFHYFDTFVCFANYVRGPTMRMPCRNQNSYHFTHHVIIQTKTSTEDQIIIIIIIIVQLKGRRGNV